MTRKRKAVVNAEENQLQRIESLIEEGRYRTVSEFVREAVGEKLLRLDQDRIAEAVERYCVAGHAAEDDDLIEHQALELPAVKPKRGRRAAG